MKYIYNKPFKDFIIETKEGTWRYWLSRHYDGATYISAIERIK